MEIAITSAPRPADIGLSGTRSRNRISAAHPVASTIGMSGTAAALTWRRTAHSTRNTTASPATSRP